ncbi:hypothetical protein HanHA89_Chr17g0722641 [Helianthus annuus]|nr:hypothetical protein HanHA89_Chr17g0722641 [Helianthus annuus]
MTAHDEEAAHYGVSHILMCAAHLLLGRTLFVWAAHLYEIHWVLTRPHTKMSTYLGCPTYCSCD